VDKGDSKETVMDTAIDTAIDVKESETEESTAQQTGKDRDGATGSKEKSAGAATKEATIAIPRSNHQGSDFSHILDLESP